MHVHVLGICGTFMGGIAALARAAGHRVTGSDANVYPPMSTQLEAQGIALIEGYDPAQLDLKPDVVVVGNVMSRGNALIERLLDSGIPFTLRAAVACRELPARPRGARGRRHARQDHDLLHARLDPRDAGPRPGFLIGGIPANFGVSARAGGGATFVIEADEYDTAFFDKRAKFVHYRPRTSLLTNLEYDHADIYPDLASIQRQFHHLLRTVPGSGRVTWNAGDANAEGDARHGLLDAARPVRAGRASGAEWRVRLARRTASASTSLHAGKRRSASCAGR